MGFEPGSTEKSAIVKSFLQSRAEGNAELPDRVHWKPVRLRQETLTSHTETEQEQALL
jgi:hypothetical protein